MNREDFKRTRRVAEIFPNPRPPFLGCRTPLQNPLGFMRSGTGMNKDSGSKVKQPAQGTESNDMNAKNYIQISGRLTSDVIPNDAKTFARFSIAHNFRSDSQETLFLDCVVFKKEFDDNGQQIPWDLLRKGQDVLVTGKLNSNSWTDRQGQRHRGMDLVLNKIRDNAD